MCGWGRTSTERGIHDVQIVVGCPLQNHEVVEPPEQDRGKGKLGQVGQVELHALALQAEHAGGPQHAACGGAVPAHAAPLPQLLQAEAERFRRNLRRCALHRRDLMAFQDERLGAFLHDTNGHEREPGGRGDRRSGNLHEGYFIVNG